MVNIIFHCSDSSFGNAALIAKWHTLPAESVVQNGVKYTGRGWDSIGYHYVILNGWLTKRVYNHIFDGHIESGRSLNSDPVVDAGEMGAHVKGHNRNSVGICLIGRSGQFTDEQLNSALKITNLLEKQFGAINLFQHSDLDKNKPKCAGLNMAQFQMNFEIYKTVIRI